MFFVMFYDTHTLRHAAHSMANRLTHPYKYILAAPVT